MQAEPMFRAIFIAAFAAMVVIRVYYHVRAGTYRERGYTEAEGKLIAALRALLGIPWFAAMVAYMIDPRWMTWSMVSLPGWARWLGAGFGVLSVILLFWVNHALGTNFSTTLRVRADHSLIRHGPYRWVRHPMYTVIVMLAVAFGLLSANWFIALLGLTVIIVVMVARTPKEEELMRERFGDEYVAYMQKTGRYLPRLLAFSK